MTSSRPSRRALLGAVPLLGVAVLLPSSASAGVAPPAAAPAFVRRDRPLLTHGVASGDVGVDSGVLWARADRPSRLWAEVSADPSFRRSR